MDKEQLAIAGLQDAERLSEHRYDLMEDNNVWICNSLAGLPSPAGGSSSV